MRAAIYARISQDRDGLSLGVERQQSDCQRLAKEKGWQVVHTYVDNDLSAFSGKARPAYQELLKAIDQRGIEAVIVWHLDRLHRHPRELEEFIELCDAGRIKLASVSGDVDLSTADGRLMARIQGAVARKESEDKSRRIRRKHEELAELGLFAGGGKRGYGYSIDRKSIIDSEAEVIRSAADRLLAGDSLRSITQDLNRQGIRTGLGATWSPPALRNILLSGRIAGLRRFRGEIIGDAVWPPILEREQWERVCALLKDPSRRKNFGRPGKYLLSFGILRCHQCEGRLFGTWGYKPKRVRRYGCQACGGATVMAEPLERFLVEAVLYRIENVPTTPDETGDTEAQRLSRQIADDQTLLDDLARRLGQREISTSEWLAARSPVQQRLEEATLQLRDLTMATTSQSLVADAHDDEALRQRWGGLSMDRQREVIKLVLDHVIIRPGKSGVRKFQPDRVVPVWRV